MGFKTGNIYQYLKEVLGVDDAYAFSKWALGSNSGMTNLEDVPKAWNERHGNEFRINVAGNIEYDLEKMVKLWKEQNKK